MIRDLCMLNKKNNYKYIVAIIYACVLFLDRLDLTIVNIALPTLAGHFKVAITQTEWVTNGFLLALAISVPISGWAGDRFGVKKVFILATAAFGLSSLLCAFSPNIFVMEILRFFQGLGGGVIIPVGMTMVYREFEHSEYASITSFIFLPTLIAPAIAPALGGIIIDFSNWKWIFILSAPICFLAVILSALILKEKKIENTPPLDWGGFIFSSLAISLILYLLSLLGKQGLTLLVAGIFAISLFFVFAFLAHEKKVQCPLIDIKFFKNKLFLQANLVQLAFQICHFGSIFLVGMYLQVGVGMSAMTSGLVMGMQAIGAMCTSRYSVKLYNEFGPSIPIIVGFVGVAFLTLSILVIDTPNMIYLGAIILFLRGIFSGLCGAPIQTVSIIGFHKNDIGRVSAIFNVGRQISISLGVALSSLLISYGFKVNDMSLYQTTISQTGSSVFYYAFVMVPVISFIGIIVALTIDNKAVMLFSAER